MKTSHAKAASFNKMGRAALTWLGAGLVLTMVSACSVFPVVPKELQADVQKQSAVELTQVPFFALVDQVYLPARKGSLQVEMLSATRRQGFVAYPLKAALPALFASINQNYPAVVLLNLSLPIAPMWHYAVVVGFNPTTQSMILRSGLYAREEIKLATFLKLWARSENWAFAVLQPDQMPPEFTEAQTYIEAVAALERSNSGKALLAYQQGLKKWPDDANLQFGLGNALFEAKQINKAQAAYKKAVVLKPNFADAWNNLAEAQWRLKQKTQARASVKIALELGGPHVDQYRQTSEKMR